MTEKDIKLTGKDKVDLAIEAGIGAIPVVGGPLQTLYFGAQNEKRFKRIEKFYNELNKELENMKSQIPPIDSIPNKDDFLGILEDLNTEVEKSKSQSKIDYFKAFYKNTLLTSNSFSFDAHSFFLESLINLTNLELNILFFLRERGMANFTTGINMPGVSDELIIGSLNRLTNYGYLTSQVNSIAIGGPVSNSNKAYKINKLGMEFSFFILNN